jgi:hypothetical protein
MEDRKKALTDMMSDDEKSGLYIDKFKKESKEIFDNEVKPQIDRAMKMEKETLEEAARKWHSNTKLFDKGELNAFIAGAKWKEEQIPSIIEQKWLEYRDNTNNEDAWCFKEWLVEQFKKK